MSEDPKLTQYLKRLTVPEDLENKIKSRLHKHSKGRRAYFYIAASVILVLAFSLVLLFPMSPPNLINVAIKDINSDAAQHIGLSIPLDNVLKNMQISLPPESMPIEMSKMCNLHGNKTLHIKIAGTKKGHVHIFIKKGDFESFLVESQGVSKNSMPWRLIKPRQELTVLILYSHDMNPVNVDKLIQVMFYS